MAQPLPFFKNYPIDWLMSEKVACMELHEVGAYKLLTDHQWLGTACTLPDDCARLKVLAKWDEGKHGDFSRVLACFPKLRSPKGRRGNTRLLKEYAAAMARQALAVVSGQKGAEMRWTKKPTRARTRPAKPTVNWLATIKADPLYAHVNFEREELKMEKWLTLNPGRVKNRAFVLNWLNKIEPPLSNGASTSLTCPYHPTIIFPDLHTKKAHDFDYHTKLES